MAIETIKIPPIPLTGSIAPSTKKYETRISAIIITVGKRVHSNPMDSPEKY